MLPFWRAQVEYFNFTALALFFVLEHFRLDLEQVGTLSSYCSPHLRGLVLFSFFFLRKKRKQRKNVYNHMNPWHQEPEIHYTIHDEKIDNKEIQISFAFSPDFPLPIPNSSLWKIRVSHQRWDWQVVSRLFLLPLLEDASLPATPSYKIIAGCHRSEQLLKELPGWREKGERKLPSVPLPWILARQILWKH